MEFPGLCVEAHDNSRLFILPFTALALKGGFFIPQPSLFTYDTDDPHAMSVTFERPDEVEYDSAVWEFARALGADALQGIEGKGDIRFRNLPGLGKLLMTLTHPQAEKTSFLIPRRQLAEFLEGTYKLVAPGDETAFQQPALDATAILLQELPPPPPPSDLEHSYS